MEVVDPAGRRVRLKLETLRHIIDNHPELEQHADDVMAAVARPDWRELDPRPGRERYYKRDVGPSRWLLVVVDFEGDPARVVTAYVNRRGPRGIPAR